MKKIIVLTILVSSIFAFSLTYAEIRQGSFSLTPYAGGYFFEGNEDWEDGATAGLRAGYHVTKNIGIEAFFSYIRTDHDAIDINDAYDMGIEGLYHFMPDEKLVPFLALGFGGLHFGNTDFDEDLNTLAADYGAGLKYFITDDVALRADVRHVLSYDNDIDKRWHNNLLVALGVNVAFGGKKEIAEVQPEEPPPPPPLTDSDGDGITDNLDKCLNTPSGVSVDQNGCPNDSDKDGIADYLDKCPATPSGAAVDKQGCPPDSDADGVPDDQDHCQGTPAGIPVDQNGCPNDSDKDGVPDTLDKCPNSPANTAVDQNGCVREKIAMMVNVEFDTAKAVIKKKYHQELKRVADFIRQYSDAKVVIEGHTDDVDIHHEPERNMRLSQARADSVRTYLIDNFNIDPAIIRAAGYGPRKPIASNKTEKGRQKNRRIEAVIEAYKVK